jgi:cysteine synthase A
VKDREALDWARRVIRREGILCGISSGAAACGADKYLRARAVTGKTVVVIFPDTGERYLSIAPFASEG